MSIKLKLEKDETTTHSEEENTSSNNEQQQEAAIEQKPSEGNISTPEKNENVDDIRHVIKLDENKEGPEKKDELVKEEKTEKTPETNESSPTDAAEEPAGELEQKRHILQSIKDFDFQIKKNQENIGKVSERINSLTKDLDDLVSLYEIVSEQMNPFVGLSKVTKKRIDALENYTKEVEELKTKIGDIESTLELKGAEIGDLLKNQQNMRNNMQQPTSQSTTEEIPHQDEVTNEEESTPGAITSEPDKIPETTDLDFNFDQLLENSLNTILIEQNIEAIINDFIQNLMT